MFLNVLLILPLLPFLGAALIGALASPLITFSMIKLFGWDEEKLKSQVRRECPEATKIKIARKDFYDGKSHIDAGIFASDKQLGTQSIEISGRVPESVYVGKVYYL